MQPVRDRVATLLAFARTTSLAHCGRADHTLMAAYIALRTADALKLTGSQREAAYYGSLLKPAGVTAAEAHLNRFVNMDAVAPLTEFALIDKHDPVAFSEWMRTRVADPAFAGRVASLVSFLTAHAPELRRALTLGCDTAEAASSRLGFPPLVGRTLSLQTERWDGRGDVYGFSGVSVPVTTYVVQLSDLTALAHAEGGRAAARALARAFAGRAVPPDVAAAFLRVEATPGFWRDMNQEAALVAMAPATTAGESGPAWEDAVCTAIADFVDAKTPAAPHHSRLVATLADAVGGVMGLGMDERLRLRRAGLVHDLGKTLMSHSALAKRLAGVAWSRAEWVSVRQHTACAAQVLERSPALACLAADAATHHERLDGRGFHRGLASAEIPLGGRILAVVNEFLHRLYRSGDTSRALRAMRPLVGSAFDRRCFAAMVAATRTTALAPPAGGERATALTTRESEVFALLARGLSTSRIAADLVVSPKTVESHLTRIYAKMGVASRAEALAQAGAERRR